MTAGCTTGAAGGRALGRHTHIHARTPAHARTYAPTCHIHSSTHVTCHTSHTRTHTSLISHKHIPLVTPVTHYACAPTHTAPHPHAPAQIKLTLWSATAMLVSWVSPRPPAPSIPAYQLPSISPPPFPHLVWHVLPPTHHPPLPACPPALTWHQHVHHKLQTKSPSSSASCACWACHQRRRSARPRRRGGAPQHSLRGRGALGGVGGTRGGGGPG